jgi:hypothetical protein
MKNENKIVELLTEVLFKQDLMAIELGGVKSKLGSVESRLGSVESRLGSVESRLGSVESRLGSVESGIIKLNLQTAENTRAIFKLSDRIEQVVDHEKRISKLENMS